ncbi:hypothetical protein [Marinimicrobium sp. ARAG 43.8]|uniref:hypothetical protein n=1 Tax=Marinimicrobium sp. ARAG 43.8 TaxID=3418719 RepID=UPI003CEB96B2
MENETSRLLFLTRVVQKEALYLTETTGRLFGDESVTTSTVRSWVTDSIMAERLDAFVARFGRLQDTIGDKLIPRLLSFLGESLGPAIDNLDKAEKFGWIDSADDWIAHRKLRNQMIHEYIEDETVLVDALETARLWVSPMVDIAHRLSNTVNQRVPSPP